MMHGNISPIIGRKRGWRGLQQKLKANVRATLPKYKVVVLISTLYSVISFLTRMIGVFSKGQAFRSFRGELLNFLEQKEISLKKPTQIFLQQIMGWEERLAPREAIKLIEQKIQEIADDRQVPELYFQLSNAYYLAGDYKKYSVSFCKGLDILRDLRKDSPFDKLGVKFLFTEDWGWGIGHITFLDALIKLRDLGLLSEHRRILVHSPEDGANKHYLNYWKSHLEFMVVSKFEAKALRTIFLPFSEQLSGFELGAGFSMLYEASNSAGRKWQKEGRAPLLSLSEEDRQRGWKELKQWGISEKDWFVTMHVREYTPHAPNHVRVRAAPNADIRTYMPAIMEIIRRGGHVIRIGDSSMSNLPVVDGLIDYANFEFKRDWMDVFLCAACKFFIGTSSGPVTLPPTFGVPVLYTNCCGVGFSPAMGRSILMPKLYYSKIESRLLSFREILGSPIGWTVRVPDEEQVELCDNSSEEILSGVAEILDLIGQGDKAFDERSQLQRTFDNLRNHYGSHASTPIARTFAERHARLIDENA